MLSSISSSAAWIVLHSPNKTCYPASFVSSPAACPDSSSGNRSSLRSVLSPVLASTIIINRHPEIAPILICTFCTKYPVPTSMTTFSTSTSFPGTYSEPVSGTSTVLSPNTVNRCVSQRSATLPTFVFSLDFLGTFNTRAEFRLCLFQLRE